MFQGYDNGIGQGPFMESHGKFVKYSLLMMGFQQFGRWVYVLWPCGSDSDGSAGECLLCFWTGGAEEVVSLSPENWFPRETQQTCGYVLLLLDWSLTKGKGLWGCRLRITHRHDCEVLEIMLAWSDLLMSLLCSSLGSVIWWTRSGIDSLYYQHKRTMVALPSGRTIIQVCI